MKREYKNKAVLICMGLIGLALVGLSIFVLKKDAWSGLDACDIEAFCLLPG